MADIGSEQQRFKILKETELEILSIERELQRIGRERVDSQVEFLKGNDRLRSQFTRILNAQQKQANQQKVYEKEIRRAIISYNNAFNERGRQAAEAHFKEYTDKLKLLSLDQQIVALRSDAIKSEITRIKEREALNDSNLENFQSFLGKFGAVFDIQKKYNLGLKKSIALNSEKRRVVAGILTILELSFAQFLKFDEELRRFRVTMGMMRMDAKRIATDIKGVAVEFAHVGVSIDGAVDATMALAEEFGGTMKISKDLVETTALMKAQLGVAESNTAGFLRNMGAISKTSAQAQNHMVYFANALSSAAGVPLNMVMQDVAKMSGNALALISKMPGQIVKTAVAARQMGTTLNKMADASSNILNFTESVQSEMEASVLVGQSINLQLARELAYRGKIVESTRAILAEARRINFEKLDFFQMQAFATASGRSADELLRMIQAQRQLQEARGIDGLKDEVAAYDRLVGLRESDLKNEGLQRELTIKRLANQERMAALQNQFNQLLLEAGYILFPIFDKTIQFAGAVMQLTRIMFTLAVPFKMVEQSVAAISQLGKYFGVAAGALAPLIKFGGTMGKIAEKVFTVGLGFARITSGVTKVLGPLAKFVLPFAKILGPIGWIITAIQLIASIWKNFDLKAPFFGLDKVIKEVLFDPFIKAWNWIKGIFVGHSPSKLALGIVRGLIGAQAMIFDALTSPFRRFLAWIVDKIPGMGGLAEKLRGGMTGAMKGAGVLEKKAITPEVKPSVIMPESAPVTKSRMAAESSEEQQKQDNQASTTLTNILTAINQLNANLSAGKIGVYIDGQLMSAQLARQTAFKGGYGMNQV